MKKPVVLTAHDSQRILALRRGRWEVGLSYGKHIIAVDGKTVQIGSQLVQRSELERAKSDSVLYRVRKGRLEPLQIFNGRLYKLVPTPGFPALEIDGIRMHRTQGMLPEEEAELKVRCLGLRPGQRMLDICTGLGYTAQAAARRGAAVITLERNEAVLKLARENPCSFEFFRLAAQGRIRPVLCDAARFIRVLPTGWFDRIMHDPPTFSLAGELYSLTFYTELRRIVADDGLLLHYTGQPGSRYRRLDLRRGVSRRLSQAGFRTTWIEEARSVLATPAGTTVPTNRGVEDVKVREDHRVG